MATTYYTWDPLTDNVLMESDENGATTAVYTHKPERHGKLISQHRNGATSYYHYDGQGSTRQLTDENGDVTDSGTYTAFGETVAKTGATTNPFGFKGAVGYYANPETEDLYVRPRMYTPALGRWLSADPIGLNQSEYAVSQATSQLLANGKDETNQPRYRVGTHSHRFPVTKFCGFWSAPVRNVLSPVGKAKLPRKVIFVQRVTMNVSVQYCDYDPFANCMARSRYCNRIVCGFSSPCTFWETSGAEFTDGKQHHQELDILTSPAYSIRGACPNTQGHESVSHEVRAFDVTSEGPVNPQMGPIEVAISKWRGVTCDIAGNKIMAASATSDATQVPFWDGPSLLAENTHKTTVTWDCCSKREGKQVLRLEGRLSGAEFTFASKDARGSISPKTECANWGVRVPKPF